MDIFLLYYAKPAPNSRPERNPFSAFFIQVFDLKCSNAPIIPYKEEI